MTILNTVEDSQLSPSMKALIEKFSSIEHYANGIKRFLDKTSFFRFFEFSPNPSHEDIEKGLASARLSDRL